MLFNKLITQAGFIIPSKTDYKYLKYLLDLDYKPIVAINSINEDIRSIGILQYTTGPSQHLPNNYIHITNSMNNISIWKRIENKNSVLSPLKYNEIKRVLNCMNLLNINKLDLKNTEYIRNIIIIHMFSNYLRLQVLREDLC